MKTPIIFEVNRGDGDCAPYPHDRGAQGAELGTAKLGSYHTTEWLPHDAERQPFPTAINLPALYAALIESLTPLTARPGEEATEIAARLESVRKLEREVAALERKIRTEPQLNRKVEIRRTLKTQAGGAWPP